MRPVLSCHVYICMLPNTKVKVPLQLQGRNPNPDSSGSPSTGPASLAPSHLSTCDRHRLNCFPQLQILGYTTSSNYGGTPRKCQAIKTNAGDSPATGQAAPAAHEEAPYVPPSVPRAARILQLPASTAARQDPHSLPPPHSTPPECKEERFRRGLRPYSPRTSLPRSVRGGHGPLGATRCRQRGAYCRDGHTMHGALTSRRPGSAIKPAPRLGANRASLR